MTRNWCNFCEENQDENTYKVKRNARDKIFGNRPDTTIVVLDWFEPEDVMVVNTKNKSYTGKRKFDLPRTSSSRSSSSPNVDTQLSKLQMIKEYLLLFPILNTISLTSWLLSNLILHFWT
jgi:hypothetical protein